MTLQITPSKMTSDLTTHTARAIDPPGTVLRWSVSWLPAGQLVTHNEAITAMTLAEIVAAHAGNLAEDGSWRVFVDQWASELKMTGPLVIAAAIKPPRPNAHEQYLSTREIRAEKLEDSWAPVARATRAALELLGWNIEPMCLPDELNACGGTFSQHAASHYAVLTAIAAHQTGHLGPSFRHLSADVYNNAMQDLEKNCGADHS